MGRRPLAFIPAAVVFGAVMAVRGRIEPSWLSYVAVGAGFVMLAIVGAWVKNGRL